MDRFAKSKTLIFPLPCIVSLDSFFLVSNSNVCHNFSLING